MKFRVPGTFPYAVKQIADRIGWSAVMRIARRSKRCVQDWSDPDTLRSPSIATAAALDRAWADAGGLGSPLRDALDQLLARPVVSITFDPARLADATAACIKEGAEAKLSLLYSIQPGATAEQHRNTARECIEAIAAYSAAIPLLAIPCARDPPPIG